MHQGSFLIQSKTLHCYKVSIDTVHMSVRVLAEQEKTLMLQHWYIQGTFVST